MIIKDENLWLCVKNTKTGTVKKKKKTRTEDDLPVSNRRIILLTDIQKKVRIWFTEEKEESIGGTLDAPSWRRR